MSGHTTQSVNIQLCKSNEGKQGDSSFNKLCGRPPQYIPAPCKLTFDLLTLKVLSESRVTWATSLPILVFLGLSVLDLGPMYATDRQTSDVRQTDVRRASSLNAPYPRSGRITRSRANPRQGSCNPNPNST